MNCESCETRPATKKVRFKDGAQFRVCVECAGLREYARTKRKLRVVT